MADQMTWGKEPPVCSCGKRLPNFAAQSVTMLPSKDGAAVRVEAVTFTVRCACGASWDLKKTCTPSPNESNAEPKGTE